VKQLGSYVIRLKLFPENAKTKKEDMVSSVASNLPDGVYVREAKSEPIAFGIEAVIMDVVAPEEEGSVEKVESSISKSKLVSQYEVLGVSRMSSKLPSGK
jgi:translation elongation factor aEF-1 beta